MTDTQDKITDKKETIAENAKQAKPLSHLEAKRAQNLRDNLLKRKAQAKARNEDKA